MDGILQGGGHSFTPTPIAMVRCIPILALALFALRCAAPERLSDVALDDRRVALTAEMPDAPFANFAMTIFSERDPEARVATRDRAGEALTAALAGMVLGRPEGEPERTVIHERMDSVFATDNMSLRIRNEALYRSARAMGFVPETRVDAADYAIELEVDDYGLGADGWEAPLYFEIGARVTLRDRRTGDVVWADDVLTIAPAARAALQAGIAVEDVATPAALAARSMPETAAFLRALAGYAADQLTRPLIEAYVEAHAGERALLSE